jgi:hypothetical protein
MAASKVTSDGTFGTGDLAYFIPSREELVCAGVQLAEGTDGTDLSDAASAVVRPTP